MRRLANSRFTPALICLGLLGCKPLGNQTVPPELDPGEHMLLTPRGDPEALLGRTVTEDESGGLLIADARAPGCRVKVRQVPQSWTRVYSQDLGRVAHFNTGRNQIGQLEVRYGENLRVDAQIDNTMVLEADLEGCPGKVIKSVKIGAGHRDIFYDKQAGASATVKIRGVDVGAGGGKWESTRRRLQWDQPQAWAFTVAESEASVANGLEIVMPEQVTEGDTFTIEILSRQQMWIVLLYRRPDGSMDLLLPNSSIPAPSVAANGVLSLPPVRASLPTPGQGSHERLVLYGFTERADFDLLRPPAGALSSTQVTEYLDGLILNLEQIPQVRWTTTTFGYQISPRPQPEATTTPTPSTVLADDQ